jgi:hypothetical protein
MLPLLLVPAVARWPPVGLEAREETNPIQIRVNQHVRRGSDEWVFRKCASEAITSRCNSKVRRDQRLVVGDR